MNIQVVKLECLKLAQEAEAKQEKTEHVLERARLYSEFILEVTHSEQ